VLAGCGDHKLSRTHTPIAAPSAKVGTEASGTFRGRDVDTKFGPVQVAITVRGGHIVDVQYLKLPFDRRRSAFISQQAAPILRQETLAAQSARIDVLSGATYTSDAWAASVAAAIRGAA
jgi:uncharacterized protein with FMN-binding domain